MPVKRSGAVQLKDGHGWAFPYSCRTTNRLLVQVAHQNIKAINGTVLPAMGLDKESRKRKNNLIPIEEDGTGSTVHDQNWINKALVMELLTSTLLTCFDEPDSVYSPCVIDDNGLPKIYAQGEVGDAWAIYRSFGILVEVSSKKDMDLVDFRTQMDQAIRHGAALAKEIGRPVYALVINECKIEEEQAIVDAYNSFVPIPEKAGDVRPMPIWVGDFVKILETIHPIGKKGSWPLGSGVVDTALGAAYAPFKDGVGDLKVGTTSSTVIKALRAGSKSRTLKLRP